MSQTTKAAPPSAPAESSNRVSLGLSNRLLARPEVGALVAAIVIFVFFLAVAPSFRTADSFFTVLYQASTIGIVAVGVGMLMIGGEFDLSAGVIVFAAGLTAAIFCYQLGINLIVGAVLALVLCLLVGFINGYLVMRTGGGTRSSPPGPSATPRRLWWSGPRSTSTASVNHPLPAP